MNQGSPIPRPWTSMGPWPVRNKLHSRRWAVGETKTTSQFQSMEKLSSIKLAPGAKKCWRPTIRMKLESILLSKRSQTPKATCCMISHIWSVRRGNCFQISTGRGWERANHPIYGSEFTWGAVKVKEMEGEKQRGESRSLFIKLSLRKPTL